MITDDEEEDEEDALWASGNSDQVVARSRVHLVDETQATCARTQGSSSSAPARRF